MRRTIEISVDSEIAQQAERIYNELGMDTEMAVGMLLRRTVMLGKLPMTIEPVRSAEVCEGREQVETPEAARSAAPGKKITREMVEAVWQAFLERRRFGTTMNAMADKVVAETGMNPGSAFIYLVILENLVNGKTNTRNMKYGDLVYCMDQIKATLGPKAYKNALDSLEASIRYWDDPKFGRFAQRVEEYVNAQRAQMG